ncbi:hypothetical protein ACF07T_24880 [Streptomyces sp. NPDC015184]|uniref:hypothetical protein n=1 Tax=Streptomyces sp. NPDC015184 TaxID=3364946 RepID=UPI0036F6447B
MATQPVDDILRGSGDLRRPLQDDLAQGTFQKGVVGGRTIPWDEACLRTYDLVLAASPKGELGLLRGSHVLFPHGAGFNKSIPTEGSADSASGLDPEFLMPVGNAPPPALSAVHAWRSTRPGEPLAPAVLTCVIGDRAHRVSLSPATDEEAGQAI